MEGPGPAAFLIAALIATAGLWWFDFVLKGLRSMPKGVRYGIYALIWLAYFILVIILAKLVA
jgi:hypothetical protein